MAVAPGNGEMTLHCCPQEQREALRQIVTTDDRSWRGSASAGYRASALHAVVLKCLSARSAKSFAILLEALLDGVIALRQFIPAKPRGIARAGVSLLRGAFLGSCVAKSQNQDVNYHQNNSAHGFLRYFCSLLQDLIRDRLARVAWQTPSGGHRVPVYLAFGELGQQRFGPFLFLEADVQHLLLVAQVQLAGQCSCRAVRGYFVMFELLRGRNKAGIATDAMRLPLSAAARRRAALRHSPVPATPQCTCP